MNHMKLNYATTPFKFELDPCKIINHGYKPCVLFLRVILGHRKYTDSKLPFIVFKLLLKCGCGIDPMQDAIKQIKHLLDINTCSHIHL
jgi:hypothetical protein